MVYYIIFYVIREYLVQHLKAVFYFSLALITVMSFFILDMSSSVMYAQVSFMRVYFFIFMLMGAITALDLKKERNERVFGFMSNGGGGEISNALCGFHSVVLWVHGCVQTRTILLPVSDGLAAASDDGNILSVCRLQ